MTQAERLAYVRSIIDTYRVGETFSDEHTTVFTEMYARHPRYIEPLKPPFEFQRIVLPGWKIDTRHVGLRTVGSNEPFLSFSWNDCIRPRSKHTLWTHAVRWEVKPQMLAIAKVGEEVHHEGVPFVQITDLFDRLFCSTPFRDAEIIPTPDNVGWMLADRVLASQWAAFHERVATLKVISKEEHYHAHHSIQPDARSAR